MKPLSIGFFWGIVLTALQIGIALLLGGSYSRLCQWDCIWYERIAQEGYHSTIPPVRQNPGAANVAFFPAYPYMARAFHLGFGLNPRIGLLMIAQVFCVAFWAALWALLKRWKIPSQASALIILGVFCHPASFYLVSGYSESLFLFSLLLFILKGSGSSEAAQRSAAFAGFAMSATRIIGIPAAGFPVLHQISSALARRRVPSRSKILPALGVAVFSAFGAALFLFYCQIRFGSFDLYMETQRIGWGIVPDYGAIWKWRSFQYRYPFDRVATQASGLVFLAVINLEISLALFRSPTGLSRRLPVYVTAFLIFFLTLSGLKSVNFVSMVRYTLPWYILLLLCLAHASMRLPRSPRSVSRIAFVLISVALALIFYWGHLTYFRRFLEGKWFA